MKWFKDWVFLPMRVTARILLGTIGVVLMGAGLAILDIWGSGVVGIPFLLIGLLLLIKSIF